MEFSNLLTCVSSVHNIDQDSFFCSSGFNNTQQVFNMVGGVRYILNILVIGLLGSAAIIIGFIVVSGVYVVKQWENAVIIRFGRIV